jgi:epoxyqueuosine reductase
LSLSYLADSIHDAALAFGYESCAAIPLALLDGFGVEVDRRLDSTPDDGLKEVDRAVFNNFGAFRRLATVYPWARAAVVAVMSYGVYQIPAPFKDRVAKYFCVDSRRDPNSREYLASAALEEFMVAKGLKVETERKYGLLPLRWAAHKAGLGQGGRNNFFYTQKGSWVHLEAWLVDQKLERLTTSDLTPCPDGCRACQKNCPTGSLAEAYLTRPAKCLTFINALRPVDWVENPYSTAAGTWIFGCDQCQNVCPHNQGAWREEREFPGLNELAKDFSLERLVALDYDYIRANLAPKFWYITPDRAWQWKVNALNALKNDWAKNAWPKDKDPVLRRALADESLEVQRMANWILTLAKS